MSEELQQELEKLAHANKNSPHLEDKIASGILFNILSMNESGQLKMLFDATLACNMKVINERFGTNRMN